MAFLSALHQFGGHVCRFEMRDSGVESKEVKLAGIRKRDQFKLFSHDSPAIALASSLVAFLRVVIRPSFLSLPRYWAYLDLLAPA